MCGIVGVLGHHEAAPLLVEALKRLEYRGYDSAGIATVNHGVLDRRLDGRDFVAGDLSVADFAILGWADGKREHILYRAKATGQIAAFKGKGCCSS